MRRKTWKLKARSTGVWFYVPSTFSAEAIGVPSLADECHWLLHKIVTLQASYKHDGAEWVNISAQTMRTFIDSHDVSDVKSALLQSGIIECNDTFRIGSHSMGYRLGPEYRGSLKRLECSKRSLMRKMHAHRIRRHDKPVPLESLDAAEQHLIACLRRVRIDKSKAYEAIDMAEQERTPEQARKVLADYYKAINRITVDQISEGNLDVVICDYGRLHTPITRLLTAARNYLTFDGSTPLATIDIANSQLVFFTTAMVSDILSCKSNDGSCQVNDQASPTTPKQVSDVSWRIKRPTSKTSQAPSASHTPQPLIKTPSILRAEPNTPRGGFSDRGDDRSDFHDTTHMMAELPIDIRGFVQRVLDGSIYEHLRLAHNRETSEDEQISSRKEFKGQFFADVLYGDTSKPWVSGTKLATIFRRLFPTVWHYIQQAKAWDGTGERKDAFKSLPRRMQRAESSFMIGAVVGRLYAHHADVPILTVHDSIICPQESADMVARIILDEFGRLGLRPTLHVEDVNGKRQVGGQQVRRAA